MSPGVDSSEEGEKAKLSEAPSTPTNKARYAHARRSSGVRRVLHRLRDQVQEVRQVEDYACPHLRTNQQRGLPLGLERHRRDGFVQAVEGRFGERCYW